MEGPEGIPGWEETPGPTILRVGGRRGIVGRVHVRWPGEGLIKKENKTHAL